MNLLQKKRARINLALLSAEAHFSNKVEDIFQKRFVLNLIEKFDYFSLIVFHSISPLELVSIFALVKL